MRLKNRLVLITGGGRGIGRAIALAFAREGAAIAAAARSRDQVEKVASEIHDQFGVRSLGIECDVAESESVMNAFDSFRAHFGRGPDIVVNNAGIAESELFVKSDEQMWERHLNVNLGGTFRCTHAALPEMIERKWGRVINIASIAGKVGAPYVSAYAASKHGVLGLTRSVALEVAGRPAEDALKTIRRMNPQNRMVTAEEVAALALLLASEDGRGINGQAINVDGGTVLF